MKLADRLSRLGTETAFAVSAEAAQHAAAGNRVYPFHIGDLNMSTPENVVEATYSAMKEGKTGYCSNYGIPELREVLAADINASHRTDYTYENVVIQPGGKPVIGKFLQTLMNPGDEVLYPNPGYPIYESMIEYHGGKAVPYRYREGKNNFELILEEIGRSITDKTRLLVFNNLQNPMGTESSSEELKRIAELVLKHDLNVLSDESYFDIRYSGKSASLVSLPGIEERAVVLYSFSKKFAMTGWRLGAAVGPKKVIDSIATLNVNDESCTNHFIQYGAIEGLTGDQSGVRGIIDILRERRDKAHEILASIEGVDCFKPEATFYLFPNTTGVMKNKGVLDYDKFRVQALQETGVSFCTRLHFGRAFPGEQEKYLRFAYSGIELDQLEEGLNRFKEFCEK